MINYYKKLLNLRGEFTVQYFAPLNIKQNTMNLLFIVVFLFYFFVFCSSKIKL